jgi:opacity protein-like surface antigen
VTYDDSDLVFAYQAGAGVAYEISPTLDLGLSYRFSGSADPTFDDGVDKFDYESQAHNFLIGLTYRL